MNIGKLYEMEPSQLSNQEALVIYDLLVDYLKDDSTWDALSKDKKSVNLVNNRDVVYIQYHIRNGEKLSNQLGYPIKNEAFMSVDILPVDNADIIEKINIVRSLRPSDYEKILLNYIKKANLGGK